MLGGNADATYSVVNADDASSIKCRIGVLGEKRSGKSFLIRRIHRGVRMTTNTRRPSATTGTTTAPADDEGPKVVSKVTIGSGEEPRVSVPVEYVELGMDAVRHVGADAAPEDKEKSVKLDMFLVCVSMKDASTTGHENAIIPLPTFLRKQTCITTEQQLYHWDADVSVIMVGTMCDTLYPPVPKSFAVSLNSLEEINPEPSAATEEFKKEVTLEEVETHNTEDDAWIVIHGAVYNVTVFRNAHPGGKDKLTPWFGKDATMAFIKLHGPNYLRTVGVQNHIANVCDESTNEARQVFKEASVAVHKSPCHLLAALETSTVSDCGGVDNIKAIVEAITAQVQEQVVKSVPEKPTGSKCAVM
eukprot:GFYU01029479.1.p1 GENE.GFYU01029479.1~~GFYU01029479.1.p1  ORF type:complete len:359 (-),score=73.33 GFYU01029479.1:188-1264(-)